jgi:phage terminase large subunit-like protein
MPRSIEQLEQRLFDKTIRIERNPCLWWNAQCAAVESDKHQNRTFSKRKARGAIDGVVSLAMAVGTSSVEREPTPQYQCFVLG